MSSNPVAQQSLFSEPPTADTNDVVHYRVGLNPVQQAIQDFVYRMSGGAVQAFIDAFNAEVTSGQLVPVYPKPGTTEALLAGNGEAYYTPNDLVEHAGLHADTVDKYLHNFIGVIAGTPEYKEARMTFTHPEAPWGVKYARYLSEPLPLRLVSARALVFIVMAPASIYRPTTGDEELVDRWKRLVQFRKKAPTRFGVPKGTPKPIDKSAPTLTSVRRTPHKTSETPEEKAVMPIPNVLLLPPSNIEIEPAEAPVTEAPEPEPTEAPAPVAAGALTDGALLDTYFSAIADLRAQAEKLRGLLDLLPPQEVEARVADFFRAGLNVLDKGRMS